MKYTELDLGNLEKLQFFEMPLNYFSPIESCFHLFYMLK